ncbi:MAG: 50S ribosomal protein L9 [Candidatus Competibacteraceae bacterium]|uniref:Large ribosomal subunit protein bL9 n=1 Tax=Candidatus Contendobacter odensis Run_B_J11 TaxID=1400861 RepID=A0A7U7GE33_9GAMM|nr:50S ribosomal protein L9 [Candidatus Contendobacter odensis]MBK8535323.1 50S ribosomal protein L9 [Candidatus Competibacteraceae bacterium]MBK8753878.1 50S ribosomal protein L9 [Candidatus Competibacteraceae bacterium]CDH46439.1 50S ribosomal subunit protein L9 [Candidatus Contendobacter odensis Run_B_J11]
MEIILLEKVAHLGILGDRVKVKSGYARNFLIPKGKATLATSANVTRFEARRAELEQIAAEGLATSKARAEQLAELIVTLSVKTGSEGRLFGSVGAVDIANAVSAAGIELQKHEVRLATGSIRQIGEYDVDLRLHNEIKTQIRVNVIAEV